jgi:hypothetical protein
VHDRAIKVDTWWDLGHSDATAIWFVQHVRDEVHLIDYYESHGQPLEYYASMLAEKTRERKYVYGRHLWPHDGGARTLASGGKTLQAMMADLGVVTEVQPRSDVQVGISRVRQVIPRCWFDEAGCNAGIEALRAYRKEEDERKGIATTRYFRPTPLHDWSSHGSDAFRVGCMSHHDPNGAAIKRRSRYAGEHGRGGSPWAA